MSDTNFVIFYVENPQASAAFYSALLQRPPVESSPTFALFALDSGLMLGLWSRHTVEPAAAGRGGASELAFTVPDDQALNQRHVDWSLRGLPILQAPTNMDFGRTFVALDPDGHRLRVFVAAGGPAAGEPAAGDSAAGEPAADDSVAGEPKQGASVTAAVAQVS